LASIHPSSARPVEVFAAKEKKDAQKTPITNGWHSIGCVVDGRL
jgi:hypothetical protein